MRSMLLSTLIFVLSGTAPALAQLPPEIQADSYLLRAEQALGEGDPARARTEIGKIILLMKEHELDLPDEFHFRYAKAAAAAGISDEALDAVVKYLSLAGREGRHYVEALELMNQAQDAIEASKESQEASNEPSPLAQEASQVTTAGQTGAGGPPEVQQDQQAQLDAAGTSKGQPLPDCGKWNTELFFRTATVASVTACIDSGSDPSAWDQFRHTPLHLAVEYNENPAVTEALLKAGADPMAQDESGDTPLHRANAAAVAEVLLKAGADPKAQDESGDTPLHRAALNGNAAVMKVLLKGGADASVGLQWTPLHEAAALNENPAATEALLKAGADPNVRDKLGYTTLLLAVRYNENPAVTEALLKAGADPMARRSSLTALHWAVRDNENPAVIEALLKAGADPKAQAGGGTPLHWAAGTNENPAMIEALLAAGSDVMGRDKNGITPLHRAATSNKNPAMIEALLAAGSDVMGRDENGITPLHRAAVYNTNLAVIEALLAAGADVMARNEFGNTPLHEVASHSGLRNAAGVVIEALLAAGANPLSRNAEGKTPWDLVQANVFLRGSDAYWRLNDARFNATGPEARRSPAGGGSEEVAVGNASQARNTGVPTGGGSCEVPGYPSPPGGVANLGLAWCPSSVSMQARAFALQAAGAQCAIATGSSSTPEQIQARRREIKEACGRLAALSSRDGINCRCPAGYGP